MSAATATQKRMASAFAQRMKVIATSPAVSGMLTACGANDAAYIPNGIDFQVFRKERSLNDPLRCAIGFPTRDEPFKGTRDAVRALSMVRERFDGELRFWSFGGRRPGYIPEWVEYHQRPTDQELQRLFNQTIVFAVPSHYEGWGLPGAEAMSCGAALASTDNGGVRVYAKHMRNALLSPPKVPEALADNVLRLLNDSNLRMTLAQQGHSDIREFTWQKAVDALEYLIQGLCRRTVSQDAAILKTEASVIAGT
jgi:glycosyltransferase involved in cell wall biosynthesis